jgi:hypothetical protein
VSFGVFEGGFLNCLLVRILLYQGGMSCETVNDRSSNSGDGIG